jgi:ribosomal-protein-alanine N-acetyltransferase
MDYTFVPMDGSYARTIVDTWAYGGEYAIYDYRHEAEHMLDPSGWGRGVFAILDHAGTLVGELSIEFFDDRDRPLEYEGFGDDVQINSREMWIGFGLRPDLVGQGLGVGFVEACVEFAVAQTGYRGQAVRLGVANFNERAIRVYERAGFRSFDRARGEIAGRPFDCIYMRKNLEALRPSG